MPDQVSPVFILSLPRSGSTLLQKLLASHNAIATAPEPWILLPSIYALRTQGISAEYWHETLAAGCNDFISRLPRGRDDYNLALRELFLRLYSALADGGERYFLDKTPRYHLIIPEIVDIFPDAKFIVLWRNPLAIAASMIDTWGPRRRWNLFQFKIDLYRGLQNLIHGATTFANRTLQLNYESLVSKPEESFSDICAYLGLPLELSALDRFSTKDLSGGLGDPTGHEKYDSISTGSIESWQKVLDNPLRRNWARNYLRWIGPERLKLMGYDHYDLLAKLDALKGLNLRQALSDSIVMPLGTAYVSLGLPEVKRRLQTLRSGERCYLSN